MAMQKGTKCSRFHVLKKNCRARFRDGYVEVPLTEGLFAKVDNIKAPLVMIYSWHVVYHKKNKKKPYATTRVRVNGKSFLLAMHRLLMGCSHGDGKFVDHKDSDTLNNRMKNLRFSTPLEGARNRTSSKTGCQSTYKGVASYIGKRVRRTLWRAYINVKRKQIYLGLFEKEKDAAMAYNRAARKFFGKFAQLNKV